MGQPGHTEEEQRKQRQDVEQPFDNHCGRRLGYGGASVGPQRDDPDGFPGPRRKDDVEQQPDEHRLRDGRKGWPLLPSEQRLPPHSAKQNREAESRTCGTERPVIRLPQRRPRRAPLDVPDGEIREECRYEQRRHENPGSQRRSAHQLPRRRSGCLGAKRATLDQSRRTHWVKKRRSVTVRWWVTTASGAYLRSQEM